MKEWVEAGTIGHEGDFLRSLRILFRGLAEKSLAKRLPSGYRSHLESLLKCADLSEMIRVESLVAQQVLAALASGLLFLLLSGDLLLSALFFMAGAAYPWLRLREKARGREALLRADLPEALEGFALCAEAGLTLEQAIEHHVQGRSRRPLAIEFVRVLKQTRAGSSRREALQAMRDRLDLPEVALFVSSVVHAERAGAGISSVLKRLSASLRDKQVQRAEKTVQEMPVKLLLPLLLCIMPVTFLILFGPVVLQLMK